MKMIELTQVTVVNGATRNPNDGPVWVDDAEWTRLVKEEKKARCVTKKYSQGQLEALAPQSALDR